MIQLNMPHFSKLSDQFSDDSSIERIVVEKWSLKNRVILEMLENKTNQKQGWST